jgi:release factor glutamine methyltransferase
MARIEAQRLLAWVLETDRGGVLARRPDTMSAEAAARFEDLLRRRERREPPQHLTGDEEFLGLRFAVDRRVLIPRPETEGVVEAALALDLEVGAHVLDVGTGSGCIAVTLAVRRPGWSIHAIDLSDDALDVARANARSHGVDSRIRFSRADQAVLPGDFTGMFDLLISNPPYVSEDEWFSLAPEVRDHEPKSALVPGPTGLEAYHALAPEAHRVLHPGGYLVLELGHQSAPGAREAVVAAGFTKIRIDPDLRQIPRTLVAQKRGHA